MVEFTLVVGLVPVLFSQLAIGEPHGKTSLSLRFLALLLSFSLPRARRFCAALARLSSLSEEGHESAPIDAFALTKPRLEAQSRNSETGCGWVCRLHVEPMGDRERHPSQQFFRTGRIALK